MSSNGTVVVIDYGIGNVFSVMRALEQCGATPELTGDPDRIERADRVVLPGVGAFGRAADRLRERRLDRAILRYLDRGRPFLGICVGLQLLMTEGYEFGVHAGLGVIEGSVDRMQLSDESGRPLRIPLIGWYPIDIRRSAASDGLFTEEGGTPPAYYFVHSYSVRPEKPDTIAATTEVGGDRIVSGVRKEHVYGVQFHPERSGRSGLDFLTRFLRV